MADKVKLPDGTPVSEKWALLYRIAAIPPVSSAEEYLRRCITDLSRAEARIEQMRQALTALANEASGFLGMADQSAHGVTNMRCLRLRIDEARAALAAEEAHQRGQMESSRAIRSSMTRCAMPAKRSWQRLMSAENDASNSGPRSGQWSGPAKGAAMAKTTTLYGVAWKHRGDSPAGAGVLSKVHQFRSDAQREVNELNNRKLPHHANYYVATITISEPDGEGL